VAVTMHVVGSVVDMCSSVRLCSVVILVRVVVNLQRLWGRLLLEVVWGVVV